jgi:hypothetical protein
MTVNGAASPVRPPPPGPAAEARARRTRELLAALGRDGEALAAELDGGNGAPPLSSNVRASLGALATTWHALLDLWEMSPAAVEEERGRHARVEAQRAREAALELSPVARVVGLDIDGVLADYAGGLLRFLQGRLGRPLAAERLRLSAVAESLGVPPATYRALKQEFRESGLEGRDADPLPGAVEFVRRLKARGYHVCLLTSRPGHRVRRLVPDTLEWLERHGVPYDACLFDRGKRERLAELVYRDRVVAFLEDSPEQAVRIADLGIPVWLRRAPYNAGLRHPGVRHFDRFEALQAEF